MSARRRAVATPAADTKCCVGSCGEPMAATCTWETCDINTDTGVRYNARLCGLRLCETHGNRVNGGTLCAWHLLIAREQKMVA